MLEILDVVQDRMRNDDVVAIDMQRVAIQVGDCIVDLRDVARRSARPLDSGGGEIERVDVCDLRIRSNGALEPTFAATEDENVEIRAGEEALCPARDPVVRGIAG